MMATDLVRGRVLFVRIRTRGGAAARNLKACVAAGVAAFFRVDAASPTRMRATPVSHSPDVALA
jgi:hypothetical protein